MAENGNIRVYWTAEVAEKIGVSTSTIRKYCIELEKQGYTIARNEKNQRAFTEGDVATLSRLKELTQVNGLTLETAVKTVMADIPADSIPEEKVANDGSAERSESDEKLNRLLEYIERQDERLDRLERFNRELVDRLEQQTKYISESMNKRDEQLIGAIRELKQSQKLIAASVEEKTEENPKGFFAKLFGAGKN
jgi:DNA-binding transcriptional MerR regulator